MVFYGFTSGSKASITGSDVILEQGTSGTSVVYMNATSAYSEVDSHSTTFYPKNNNVTLGVYVSGTTPDSVNQKDSEYFIVDASGSAITENHYYPSNINLIEGTTQVSGSLSNLTTDDQVYLTLQSYRSNLNTTHYVDTNTSNVDSVANTGTFYNLVNQQSGPDSLLDALTEEELQVNKTIDYVDLDNSNIDGKPGIGTHSDFNKSKLVDGVYDTLTEALVVKSETLSCNSYSDTFTQWSRVGASPWLDTQDQPTNYVWVRANTGQTIGWFGFPDTTLTGTITMSFDIYCRNEQGVGNDGVNVYVDYTGTGSGSYLGRVAQHTNWQYDTFNLGSRNASEVNGFRVYLEDWKTGQPADVFVDHLRIRVSNSTYRLDLEVQFTNVNTAYEVTELCLKTGTTGAENLGLSIWNSSASNWVQLTPGIPDSNWFNTTVSSYVGSNMYLRFLDGERIELTQSSWQIDGILLKQYNLTYQLDVELQWNNAVYNDTHEYLCIYGGSMGAENILVDVWYNSTWVNLLTDLSPGWNNLSVTAYLDSSTFTLRLRDAVKLIDHVQDTWEIDVSLLNTWTDEFTAEAELEGSSNLFNWAEIQWTVDSSWSNNTIDVEVQLYNYQASTYETSGQAYLSYTSGYNYTDETKVLLVSSNPTDYRNSTGWWKAKIKGVSNINYPFQLNIDYTRFNVSHYIEYTAETEFIFTDVTANNLPYMNFTVVTHNSVDGATVTIQVWNYTSSSFPTSGQGYTSYVSTGFNNTSHLNVTLNPGTLLSGTYARIRVTSALATTQSYQQQTNFVRLLQDESQRLHDYALRITNTGADPYTVRLNHLGDADTGRLINCTIYLSSGGTQLQVLDGVVTVSQGGWVGLGGFSSLDILIIASSTTRDPKSSISAEVEALKTGTSTYTKLPVQFVVY